MSDRLCAAEEISSTGVTADVVIDLAAFVVTVEDFANFTAEDLPDFTSVSGVCRQGPQPLAAMLQAAPSDRKLPSTCILGCWIPPYAKPGA